MAYRNGTISIITSGRWNDSSHLKVSDLVCLLARTAETVEFRIRLLSDIIDEFFQKYRLDGVIISGSCNANEETKNKGLWTVTPLQREKYDCKEETWKKNEGSKNVSSPIRIENRFDDCWRIIEYESSRPRPPVILVVSTRHFIVTVFLISNFYQIEIWETIDAWNSNLPFSTGRKKLGKN